MKLNEIATILNQTIVPNILGQEITITEDLSNINLIVQQSSTWTGTHSKII